MYIIVGILYKSYEPLSGNMKQPLLTAWNSVEQLGAPGWCSLSIKRLQGCRAPQRVRLHDSGVGNESWALPRDGHGQ